MRRTLIGSAVGWVLAIGLAAAMVPVRSHLSIATAGLVLVVPVAAGVVTGGFLAGIASVAAGFLAFDVAFIPPYWTLTVGHEQNWVALVVYVVVMALIARVVSNLDEARAASSAREMHARSLLDSSELLVTDASVGPLAQSIVSLIADAFEVEGVTLLLSVEGRLEVAASTGTEIGEVELARLRAEAGRPVALRGEDPGDPLQAVALVASGRPVGLLALTGRPGTRPDADLLSVFVNHAALALERARLRERALQAELLEEVDRLRHALVGAVSHDLRTPLATIKVASSTLLEQGDALEPAAAAELYALIDLQTDRLGRLVNNLLDMTRIQSGALEVRREAHSLLDLVTDAITALRPALGERPVDIDLPPSLPLAHVDALLIGEVLINLLDNADRHAPKGSAIVIAAELHGGTSVALSVEDEGPGVPESEREAIFERFVRFDTGGRSGLGLAIAKAFVEAHDGRIAVTNGRLGGARFEVVLPLAAPAGSRAG